MATGRAPDAPPRNRRMRHCAGYPTGEDFAGASAPYRSMFGFRAGLMPATAFFGRQLAPFFAQAGTLFGRQVLKAFSGLQQAALFLGRQLPEAALAFFELFAVRWLKSVLVDAPAAFAGRLIPAPTLVMVFVTLAIGQAVVFAGFLLGRGKGRFGNPRGLGTPRIDSGVWRRRFGVPGCGLQSRQLQR